jgi:hypothetical protein
MVVLLRVSAGRAGDYHAGSVPGFTDRCERERRDIPVRAAISNLQGIVDTDALMYAWEGRCGYGVHLLGNRCIARG